MIRSVAIFHFSATGNTKKVAHQLAANLEEAGVSSKLFSIEDQLKKGLELPSLDDYDMIGIAHPIYGFTTPKIVDTFVAALPRGDGKRVFLLKTGADFIAINHNASEGTIAELENRGFEVVYDRIIVMPSNFAITYKDNMIKQVWTSAQEKCVHMSAELVAGTRRRYEPGRFMRATLNGLAFVEKNYFSPSFGASLFANESCNLCGMCERKCPMNNVSITDGKASFGDACMACMRCVYRCPKEAIVSKGMNMFALKGGYDLGKSLKNDEVGSEFVTKKTRGYFKHFLRYFEDAAV